MTILHFHPLLNLLECNYFINNFIFKSIDDGRIHYLCRGFTYVVLYSIHLEGIKWKCTKQLMIVTVSVGVTYYFNSLVCRQ